MTLASIQPIQPIQSIHPTPSIHPILDSIVIVPSYRHTVIPHPPSSSSAQCTDSYCAYCHSSQFFQSTGRHRSWKRLAPCCFTARLQQQPNHRLLHSGFASSSAGLLPTSINYLTLATPLPSFSPPPHSPTDPSRMTKARLLLMHGDRWIRYSGFFLTRI